MWGAAGLVRSRMPGDRSSAACRPTGTPTQGWQAASQPPRPGATCQVRTENVDLVLSQITADECNEAAEELAHYLDAGLITSHLMGSRLGRAA